MHIVSTRKPDWGIWWNFCSAKNHVFEIIEKCSCNLIFRQNSKVNNSRMVKNVSNVLCIVVVHQKRHRLMPEFSVYVFPLIFKTFLKS